MCNFRLFKISAVKSFTFNAWNGFTEGLVGMPTLQYGEDTYQWICKIYQGRCGYSTGTPEEMNPNTTEALSKSCIIRDAYSIGRIHREDHGLWT